MQGDASESRDANDPFDAGPSPDLGTPSDADVVADSGADAAAVLPVEYGVVIGYMDVIFHNDGTTITIQPGADLALTQLMHDGFTRLRMMEPFARGYLSHFPSLPVQAIRLLEERGFTVLLSVNGSPFLNGDTASSDSWVYRYFPGDDLVGSDDDGGLTEHTRRLTQFMDALRDEGLLDGMQIQLFDEPNAPNYFWGTYSEWETLLAANLAVFERADYGLADEDILCGTFTSNLMEWGPDAPAEHQPYWDFATHYLSNPLVNRHPFSFHWYPMDGISPSAENYLSSDIKLVPMYEGSWITEMNVTAYMTENALLGNGTYPGYRERDSFREKVTDIIAYANANHLRGIYFFNVRNKTDTPTGAGALGLGLFNAAGCPRYEYVELLEILGRPLDLRGCPMPLASEI